MDNIFFSVKMLDKIAIVKNDSNSALRIIKASLFIVTFMMLFASVVFSEPMGPLTVHQTNTRYFAKQNGNPVYLTGSHTWNNFQDISEGTDIIEFDYMAYLDFLNDHGHNFIRLWVWENSRGMLSLSNPNIWMTPLPYQRTGPGKAADGLYKFDLTKFNQDYFDRLRSRVEQARSRGIYVSIMLFNGWSVAKTKGSKSAGKPWSSHPLNAANNVNGVNGDLNGDQSGEETHELRIPAVTAIQESYVRKVIDTINDLDNVLYEISNESHFASQQWQYHMIDLIKSYEATKLLQHPVGMTIEYPDGNNNELFNGNADWVSPNGDINNPPSSVGSKVVLSDTDHLCGICGDRIWVWKAFTRGENPIFMDAYSDSTMEVAQISNSPGWESLRWNMGDTRSYADRMDLGKVMPQSSLASTMYCLADPGMEYLVYQPNSGRFSVEMTAGGYNYEWFDPATGRVVQSGVLNATEGSRWFTPPFSGDAVLFLKASVTDIENQSGPAPPAVDEVVAPASTKVEVTFSREMDPVTAKTAANYSIDKNVSVLSASLTQPDMVTLSTSVLSNRVDYTLRVSNVKDLYGIAIPAPGVPTSFQYLENADNSIVVAINCGGSEYIAMDGTQYRADNYYLNGNTYSRTIPISATLDDSLYQSVRYSRDRLSYSIPIIDGDYEVTLKFAELFYRFSGQRTFDVAVEGVQEVNGLDIVALVGPAAAYEMTFDATVTDKSLDVDLVGDVNNPMINAVVVKAKKLPNRQPVAEDQNVVTVNHTPVAITLHAMDADSDPLTYRISKEAANGSITGTPPEITYAPYPDYIGLDSFTYTANDGRSESNEATVTINVEGSPLTKNLMHINSLKVTIGGGWWRAKYGIAKVQIVDVDGFPVEGATITGQWSGAASDVDQFTTGLDGFGTAISDRKFGGTFIFCVTNVTRNVWDYNPDQNSAICASNE